MTPSDSKFIKIVIFDDSHDALKRFKNKFSGKNVEIMEFLSPLISNDTEIKLIKFQPQLIVVDLIMGGSNQDGYDLIAKLQKIEAIKKIPIIVCSKLINPSEHGEKEKEDCLILPGVVAALSKFPDYPNAEEFLKYIHEG